MITQAESQSSTPNYLARRLKAAGAVAASIAAFGAYITLGDSPKSAAPSPYTLSAAKNLPQVPYTVKSGDKLENILLAKNPGEIKNEAELKQFEAIDAQSIPGHDPNNIPAGSTIEVTDINADVPTLTVPQESTTNQG